VDPQTTVVIGPREVFSNARPCLESVLTHTTVPYRLVYVDGGSPARQRAYLDAMARAHDFTLVRCDYFLSPNEGRNIGLDYVDTPFVVFLDDSAIVSAGWLERLEACAHETGARIVGPLVAQCIGDPECDELHDAGGDNRIVDEGSRRWHHETHEHVGESLAECGRRLQRHPTEQVEFHCMLVRADVFAELGPLDESLLSLHEHVDLCLAVRERGGEVWLEPSASVVSLIPPRLTRADRRYFLLRWSGAWNRATLEHFWEKWALAPDDPSRAGLLEWARAKRLHAYRPYRSPFAPVARRRGRAPRPLIDRIWGTAVARREQARRSRGSGPRLVRAGAPGGVAPPERRVPT
jgi:hypothetical protein